MFDLENTLHAFPWGEIVGASEVLDQMRGMDRRVYTLGNGGSAATASHFATDLNKYCSPNAATAISAESLNDNASLSTALVNDVGWDELYVWQLERKLRPDDVVVLFSVHGGTGAELASVWSQNVLRAAELAKRTGAKTIAFTGFDGGPLKQIADISVHVSAWSTPIVEGWHSLAAHLVVENLLSREVDSV